MHFYQKEKKKEKSFRKKTKRQKTKIIYNIIYNTLDHHPTHLLRGKIFAQNEFLCDEHH